MKIYSMTATFGKLEHQTLTLEPGLNVIEAPNEWGKSTWCAFLVNMLYGIDTRARSTGAALADKERYAPWSGSPMAGRIDLDWNGRDITIERRSRGRIIFGDFKAYETHTGLDVPELNGLNCGQMLLGVERSVFIRSGFLRQNDLAVTQDESLRRRLNNLVTTGDESGAGDKLSSQLRDLKNKCRYNRTGLLPQAEAERDLLKDQLSRLHGLQNQAAQILTQQTQLEQQIHALENHKDALLYAAATENTQRITQAEQELDIAKDRLAAQMALCESLPSRETSQKKLAEARQFQESLTLLQSEERMLPALPEAPVLPPHYQGVAAAAADRQKYNELERAQKRSSRILWIFAAAAVAALAAGIIFTLWPLYCVAVAGIAGSAVCAIRAGRSRTHAQQLRQRYPDIAPDGWVTDSQNHADAQARYEALLANAEALRDDLQQRKAALQAQISQLTEGASLDDSLAQWHANVHAWDDLASARQELQRLDVHVQTLRSMIKPVSPAKHPDPLSYNETDTLRMLQDAQLKQRQLHTLLGQCQGQAEALGTEALLRSRLDALSHRIARLEDLYYALEMAQDALRDATNTLQRRFAPRISKQAQSLFETLTDGKYLRLTLAEDLSLHTSAIGEDTLHSAQWRSDGTADQQYLALRLAVAGELMPDAPLILDDAMVRFDDERLAAAMRILAKESKNKQVILFTCQSREMNLIRNMEESV